MRLNYNFGTIGITNNELSVQRPNQRPLIIICVDKYCGSEKNMKMFLRATAGTAIARLSHRNSVCLSVRLSVTRVDQAKTLQARIIKSSPSLPQRL